MTSAGPNRQSDLERAASYFLDPVLCAQHILGDKPWWSTQIAMANAIAKPGARVAVKGCHSSSKTYSAAQIMLWFITRYKDGIAIDTAPGERQVKEVMWSEIRKALGNPKIKSIFPSAGGMDLRITP